MTSEQERQKIRLIVGRAEQQDDPRAAIQLIQQGIAEMNNLGEEVPQELLLIQNYYVDECIHESQGR